MEYIKFDNENKYINLFVNFTNKIYTKKEQTIYKKEL